MGWKILAGLLALAGGIWVVRQVMTPAPGQKFADLGREHVTAEKVAQTHYNSNPPTSGPHVPTWVKPGIYKEPQAEGELIHSLEHGYINISYNCTGSPEASGSSVASGSAALNDTEACKTLVSQLENIARKKKLFKLLVVPRPQMDTKIALAAWTYLDTFDMFDAARIERFVDYHRDHGPEQTME